MTIVFAGGEIGAFVPSDGNVTEVTTSGKFDSTYARSAIRIQSSSASYAESRAFASNITTLWLHANLDPSIVFANAVTIANVYDSVGTEVLRLRAYRNSANCVLDIYYWNGSAFVQVGADFAVANDALHTLDVKFVVSTGAMEFYVNGTLRDSGTASPVGFSNFTKLRLWCGNSTNTAYWSEVIVSNTSTVGLRLSTMPISGAGNSNNFTTGTYADVDENVYADADGLTSATNGQVAVFAGTSPTLSGYAVQAMIVTARARAGTLLNLQLAIRTNNTNYFTASQALSAGYGAFVGIWETDPNTTIAWVGSTAQAVQFGVKSIT